MGQHCQCCISSKRLDIDKAIVAGGNLSEIARNFGVSYSSVTHHRDRHISRQLLTAAKQRDLTTSGGLLDIMENLFQVTNLVVSEAWRQKKLGVCLSGIGKASGLVKIIADMVYQLKDLELQKERVDKPISFNVSIVDDTLDYDLLSEEERQLLDSLLAKAGKSEPIDLKSELFKQPARIEPRPARQLIDEKPVIDVEPVKRFVRRSKAKPEQAIKDKTSDEFEAMRKKYLKPAKVPDEVPNFTDAELDEVDGEGLTMRERLEIRPLHERAH